ncbi:Alpha-L-arabinofuranosidase [bacterium A37T11]|nr:Alpha-L-arabinofuranosidase [bacterium A37T11]
MHIKKSGILALAISSLAAPALAQPVQPKVLTIQADKPIASVPSTMWGIFFEDINLGADGGIYAELVKNRSFEFRQPLMGWKRLGKPMEGDLLVLNRTDNTSNPRFIRIKRSLADTSTWVLSNEGFRGMGIKKDLRYDFSLLYRAEQAGIKLKFELRDSSNHLLGEGHLTPETPDGQWHKQSVSFQTQAGALRAHLDIWAEGAGTLDLDMLSLFPADTWKGRPGGMRADMIQMLADLKPGFIRFPGGCIVEGYDLSTRYQWKKTIGPVEDRQLIINRWNNEFAHRPTPDYFQTFGLGFFEYFQLAEDIGAEPLPILNCGMACQFNSAELVPIDELDPYVQDALDLIEFANGPADSPWGKIRASMGHPAPFHLKMLGVGNENWGPQYLERLAIFEKALHSRYPDLHIVASSGTDPNGERFDLLNTGLRKMNINLIDEHYYRPPSWFFENAGRYDHYDRQGPKIFAGEYAAQSKAIASPDNKNTWETALAEAAFMTGLERNAGVVSLASYAPLFAHVDGWQWTPDLIWVDNLHVYGTPNYYIQKLYSTNKGTQVLPLTEQEKALSGQDGYFASAVRDDTKHELIIKIVNHTNEQRPVTFALKGVKKVQTTAKQITLNGDLHTPEETTIKASAKKVDAQLAPNSFNVIKIKLL